MEAGSRAAEVASLPSAQVWSMRQARALTSTPDRGARNLVKAAALPASNLSSSQVLALRCLHAAESLPSEAAMAVLRRREITGYCEQVWAKQADSLYLAVSASKVRLLELPVDSEALLAELLQPAPTPLLMLPVSQWAFELTEQMRRAL